jgi:4-diphosphocytidyl-2-C-methyl-D-erythritol kinase
VRIRALAPGKVNICLFLGNQRGDGRHALVTLMETVSLADGLELSQRERGADEVRCAGVEGPNLVATALSALRERGWTAPPVEIEIAKRIPVAAGMGGGSADAAAALRMAQQFHPLPADAPAEIAAALGADVPGLLASGLALATGAGEQVEQCAPLAQHAFVIVPLPTALATAAVYAEADRLGLPRGGENLRGRHRELSRLLRPGARLPAAVIVNDLEPAAVSLCPQIAAALEAVRASGADHALVSGSGPTVAGLYWGPDAPARSAAAAAELADSFPGATVAEPVGPEFGSPQFA